jgi:hypothetical protein
LNANLIKLLQAVGELTTLAASITEEVEPLTAEQSAKVGEFLDAAGKAVATCRESLDTCRLAIAFIKGGA